MSVPTYYVGPDLLFCVSLSSVPTYYFLYVFFKNGILNLFKPGLDSIGFGVEVSVIQAAFPGVDILFLVEENVVAKSYNFSKFCYPTTYTSGFLHEILTN